MTVYGYARVSTKDQILAVQETALRAAGCVRIYAEKASGVKTDRPELAKLLRRLDEGDVLVVNSLDRLARSTRDLLNILDDVAKTGASFRSLHDVWADTTTPHGKLLLTVLAGLAEFERTLIFKRTSEGRTRAKERGVRFGRPHSLTPHQQKEAIERIRNGEGLADIARSYAVSHQTVWRLARAMEFKNEVHHDLH
jgi:DNA invertase Pin-like site-specific DNA recombinase